ncbi:MAG: DNA polymerase III subunit beta [Chromatiales bacterium]|nr:DNA polymerase III subunit beta [Chromatiales bacterium]
MHIRLKNKILLEILSSIKGVVPSRPAFPIQSMVLLVPEEGGCYFYTQGPEAQMRYFSPDIKIEKPEKKLTSVSRVFEISRNFPEDSEISLKFSGDSLQVSCEGGQYKLKSLPSDDFPLMNEPEKKNIVKLPEKEIKNLLEKTDFCIALQDPRHYLNGLLLSLNDKKLSAVSTDSHRLALSSVATSNTGKAEGILPRDIVAEAKRILSDTEQTAEIGITPQNISISLQNIQILAKALNGQFPEYEKIIPRDFSIDITLNREEFLRSLQRASAILASSFSEEVMYVSLIFSNKELLVKSRNPDGEEAEVKQKTQYEGKEFEIAFNSRYLQDVMKALDTEKVSLQIRDSSSGVRIIGYGSTTEEYVVMPLRL